MTTTLFIWRMALYSIKNGDKKSKTNYLSQDMYEIKI